MTFFFNIQKMLFLLLMMLGTMISFTSSSWPATWIGLEINLLSFIPIIYMKNNILTYEAAIKYFLIQALASSIFLTTSIVMSMILKYSELFNNMLTITMMIKLGGAPFHMWFPPVMEGLTWFNCLLLMTLQKIAPMMVLSYISTNLVYNLTILSSVIIGTISGINQTSTRKILAYSSINHLGWMLLAMKLSQYLWKFYFMIYSMMIILIISILKLLSVSHLNQMNLNSKSTTTKMIFMLNMLSLGGLPPFLGFMPKWIVIESAMDQKLITMILMMVWMSLITLYYYLQLSMSTFLMSSSHLTWNYMYYNSSIPLYVSLLTLMSLLMLPMYSMMNF